MSSQPPLDLRNQAGDLIRKVDGVQGRLEKSGPIKKPISVLVWACFVVGTICILFYLYKAATSGAQKLDLPILFVGFVLCTISMLTKFEIGPKGVTAEVRNVLSLTKDLVIKLTQ
jgi:hypothetical protein